MSRYELTSPGRVYERLLLCSCLPRECSQTMFIVLGGFQGEWAVNDGSWSPGLQARRMQVWWGEETKGRHDQTRGEEGEKTVS